jgi:hypothetical protein
MYTHHDTSSAADLAGRVSRVWQDEDGSARFTADIADTPAGRAIAALADGSDGRKPFLRGVSIRGNWVGGTRRERAPDGTQVETGSDLEIGRLDWTGEPGVEAAGVDEFQPVTAESRRAGSYMICESVPEVRVKAGKKAGKAAKRARETAKLSRLITESLTAAQAPQPSPGTGAAPVPAAPENEAFAAIGAGQASPFWRMPNSQPVHAPEAARPLHEMDADEFRAHAARTFTAHSRSQGFGSPSWQ